MSDAMQTRERITDPDFLFQLSRVTADCYELTGFTGWTLQ